MRWKIRKTTKQRWSVYSVASLPRVWLTAKEELWGEKNHIFSPPQPHPESHVRPQIMKSNDLSRWRKSWPYFQGVAFSRFTARCVWFTPFKAIVTGQHLRKVSADAGMKQGVVDCKPRTQSLSAIVPAKTTKSKPHTVYQDQKKATQIAPVVTSRVTWQVWGSARLSGIAFWRKAVIRLERFHWRSCSDVKNGLAKSWIILPILNMCWLVIAMGKIH